MVEAFDVVIYNHQNNNDMKLRKFDIDKKLSIAQMKQVKAGSVASMSGNIQTFTNTGCDSDRGGQILDTNN